LIRNDGTLKSYIPAIRRFLNYWHKRYPNYKTIKTRLKAKHIEEYLIEEY